jgi:hypothetical protein
MQGVQRLAVVILALACAACGDAPLAPLTDLPADLAAVSFSVEGRPTAPYTMLELRQTGGFSGFVAVDRAGRPVWYFRTQGTSSGFTRRRNGDFVFLDGDRGLVEVARDGHVVHELAQQARPGRRIHHDVTVSDHNTVLFLAEDTEPWEGAALVGDAVWEWDPEAGTTTRRWSSHAFLDPHSDWGARSNRQDWLHANSLFVAPGGNVLVSFHFLNQVISLAPDFSRVQWRLGGVGATLPVDDPFTGQHTAQQLGNGHVLLFDNGFERSTPYSRAAEYALQGQSATRVWQWRPERDNWARIISSARRLGNGNTVVGFGTTRDFPAGGATGPIEVYEVTPAGSVVWHLGVSGAAASMYRATPLMSL